MLSMDLGDNMGVMFFIELAMRLKHNSYRKCPRVEPCPCPKVVRYLCFDRLQ